MRLSWIRREPKFFDMLDDVAALTVAAAKQFADLVEFFDHPVRRTNELRELEHQCDLAVQKILVALGKAFLTPIDREDIHTLATRLDDVTDNIEETAFRLMAFIKKREIYDWLESTVDSCRVVGHTLAGIVAKGS
jgi:uncharacterized protein Yka (UPF0111/DUF47 family)